MKMYSFRTDSEFECSEFEPRLYTTLPLDRVFLDGESGSDALENFSLFRSPFAEYRHL